MRGIDSSMYHLLPCCSSRHILTTIAGIFLRPNLHHRLSLVFLSPLAGYVLAALLNHPMHNIFGQRGVALVATFPPHQGCHLIAYIVNCLHPPYPVLVVSFIFARFGKRPHGLGVECVGWEYG